MNSSDVTTLTDKELHKKIALLEQKLSEYKKRANQVQASEEYYYTTSGDLGIVENMNSGVAVYGAVDNGNNFVFNEFNKACERIEHISRDEVIGRLVTDVFPGIEEFGLLKVFRRVWQTGKPEHYPVEQYTDFRITGWRDNYVYKLNSNEIVSIYEDVTEKKQIENNLKVANEIINRSPSVAFLWENSTGWPIKFVSENVEQLTGYSPEELSSGTITYANIIYPDDLERVINEVKQAGKDTNINHFRHEPYRIITKNNEERWVADNTYIKRDHKGQVIYYQGIVTDITSRELAVTALQESEERYRDIMENSSDFIMTVSPDFHLVYANRSLQRELGYSEKELNGLSMMNIIHPEKTGSCTMKFKKLLSGEPVGAIETFFITKDGKEISVEGRCNCKYFEGELLYIHSIFRDTTLQKKMQKELQQAQRLESVGILAGGIAHDFNNLLCGIGGVISVVKASLPPDDERNQMLNQALESCMMGKEITTKFITFAEGGSPITSRIKINDILKDTVQTVTNEYDIRCNLYLADDLLLTDVDITQFREVIRNMTKNACEAMDDKGVLTVTTENESMDSNNELFLQEGQYIRVDLKDQGKGLPDEDLDKIFLPYFSSKSKGKIKGSGLGLSVCSSIIRRHKGKITVESARNEGTTFHVYLPAFAPS